MEFIHTDVLQEESEINLPPHSTEAEQSVLGRLLLDASVFDKISGVIAAQDFFRFEHGLIFRQIEKMLAEDAPIDIITLSERLDAQDNLKICGGIAYLATLAQNTPSAANIRRYAEIVKDRSVRRSLIRLCESTIKQANGSEITAQELVKKQSDNLDVISDIDREEFAFQYSELLKENIEKIDYLYSREDKTAATGIATGFADLDVLTNGFQKGDLIIVAGRPSMGKTALAMNIAENVAIREKKSVLIFSMEMAANQLSFRSLSSVGKIDQQVLATGNLKDEHWTSLTNAIRTLTDVKIAVYQNPALSVSSVRMKARQENKREKIDLIVVDYLQLMSTSSKRGGNRATEVGELTRGLKQLAKELDVPVVVISQLSRACEQRADKRPMMSDLRESGAIEQDADMILFVYRHEKYDPQPDNLGRAELILAKNRNGAVGRFCLKFVGEKICFEDFKTNGNEYYEF